MPIRCRTLRSFLEYWVFSATERLFPSKGALESDSRTGPDWIAPERRDYRNVAQVAFGLKIPHSDKTSCALGAPPSMKMGAAPYRAVNGLFSVGVEAIFIAAGLIRMWQRTPVLIPAAYVFFSRGMSFVALSRSTNFSSASVNIFNSRIAWACSNMWPPGGKSVPNRILSGVTSWRREATTPG